MLTALKSNRWTLVGFVVLLFLVFLRLMNFEIRRDEQLYLPPARLLADQNLYADFFYNHPPVSALYFRAMHMALGSDWLLLNGRLAILVGWAVFGVALIAVTYRLTRSTNLAAFALVSIFANGALLNQTGMAATNNLLVLAASYMGLGLFLVGVLHPRISPLLVAAAGISLSLAAGIKASAIVFIPFVVLAAFLLPNWSSLSERFLKVVLPLAIGGLIGALPVFNYLMRDPDRFMAHVIGFHTGPHVAYWANSVAGGEEVVALSMTAKALLAFTIWSGGANLVLALVVIALIAAFAMSDSVRNAIAQLLKGELALITLCFLAAFIMSFVPTPGFPQYFSLPLVCVPLLMALLHTKLTDEDEEATRPMIAAATIVTLAIAAPQLLENVPRIASPAKWTVMRSHAQGVSITKAMADAGVTGKVATLAPIYALEGGNAVYPEFATGQFAYRTAQFNDPKLKSLFRTTSPAEIEAFLANDPPAAILVGFETTLEEPLLRFAGQNGYKKIESLAITDRYGTGVLYTRTTSGASN